MAIDHSSMSSAPASDGTAASANKTKKPAARPIAH
jgi:hypothetical protein